jgi:hypothetical protein
MVCVIAEPVTWLPFNISTGKIAMGQVEFNRALIDGVLTVLSTRFGNGLNGTKLLVQLLHK